MLKKALFMYAVLFVMPLINGMERDDLSVVDETDMQNVERFLSHSKSYYTYYQQHKNDEGYGEYWLVIQKYENLITTGKLKKDGVDRADLFDFIDLVEQKDVDDYVKDVEWVFPLVRGAPYALLSALCVAGWYYYG